MKRPLFIARQAGNPKGPIGAVLARIMARETVVENSRALSLLKLQPTDYILEVGAGHGATIKTAAEIVYNGFVAGLDISHVMVRRAEQANKQNINEGRVDILLASSDRIPFSDATFSKALAVHTVYFWDQPASHFSEILRTLIPGGLFLLCFRPAEDEAFAETFPSSVYHIRGTEDLLSGLRQTGFEIDSVNTETGKRGTLIFATARKPSKS
ncbi:MAG: class I SAM-dependent methyltransferase [Parasphingorhabdus sp.]